MAKLDVTKTNDAVERLLETTENPRHRFLLHAYYRHRFLEIAGRHAEIFVPEMMVEHPVYHLHHVGANVTLEGREQVEGLYAMWGQNHESIFYADDEQVAVADNFIASVVTIQQQVQGKSLIANGFEVDDENAMYLHKALEEMIWPYDDRGRLVGEDVWTVDPSSAQITKLDPADVLTTGEAARLLDPLIKPLPSFDGAVMGRSSKAMN
jgi:hypothetical protein